MFNNISDAYMFALKTVYFNYEFIKKIMVMRLKPLVLLVTFGVWIYGLVNFYAVTQKYTSTKSPVDGIVILTGGKDRIQTGMALFSELRAKRVLISGVDINVICGILILKLSFFYSI